MPWAKGQSGNPTGGSKAGAAIRALARTNSEEAYNTVLGLMREADKDATRLAAAIAILRVAGVPMSADVNITVTEKPAAVLAEAPTDALVSVAGMKSGTLN